MSIVFDLTLPFIGNAMLVAVRSAPILRPVIDPSNGEMTICTARYKLHLSNWRRHREWPHR